ncbi:MAG: hypothetical protein JNL70_09380 [Saprospiraceae bacterium]|nr:hypothetical protein [Saprospiraceae bacterium]
MIQFDCKKYPFSYAGINDICLADIQQSLSHLLNYDPENENAKECLESVISYFEMLIEDGTVNPTEIELYETQEEAATKTRTIKFDLPNSYFYSQPTEAKEILYFKAYDKKERITQFFLSEKEAKECIESIRSEPFNLKRLTENELFRAELRVFELRRLTDNFYWVESSWVSEFPSMSFLFFSLEEFESFFQSFAKETALSNYELKIERRVESCFFIEKFRFDSVRLVLKDGQDEHFYHETPLFFLLSYCFKEFWDTQEFLDYHLENSFSFDKLKYKTFLEDALAKFGEMITTISKDAHLEKIKNYILNLGLEKHNLKRKQISKKLGDYKEGVYDIEDGFGNLNKKQIDKFFDFLCTELSDRGEPYLSKDDCEELKKIGLCLPVNGIASKTFTLNMSDNHKWVIYSYFFVLWKKHANSYKGGTKSRYALFLDTYFTNFSNTDESSLRKHVESFCLKIEQNYF